MESASIGATYGGRPALGRPPLARLPDRALKWTLAALAGGVLILIGFFFVRLYIEAKPAFDRFGYFGFTFTNNWDVHGETFGALPLLVGIMIIPIVSAITREVVSTVPLDHKEAALALGATRWEMIKMAVLPYSRSGITGAAMLGLGRAMGETIAATIVIGNAPVIGKSLFDQGYTLAAVIANEFGEAASDPLHRAALIAAGLLLFLLTLIVNALARGVIVRGPARVRGGESEAFGATG